MNQNGNVINQQAIEWLINLQETPDDKALLARFSAWYQESAAHRRAWDEANATWNALEGLAPPSPVVTANVAPIKKSRSRWLPLTSLAATIILAIGLYFPITQWYTADYYTHTGEIRKIVLDDGSTLWLSPKSALKVDYQAKSRNVKLLSGEAYFSVQPDPSRPFHVITDLADSTVLGTAFNVNLAANRFNIIVNHGSVAVTAHGTSQRLRPPLKAGDWLQLTPAGSKEWGNSSPDNAGLWRSGKLVISNRPVEEVLDELRRYYRGVIILTDSTIKTRRLTGAYDLNDPENTLLAIAKVQHLKLIQLTPWVTFLSRN